MPNAVDGTQLASEGMFFIEGAGGSPEPASDHQSNDSSTGPSPSCFGYEEEKGAHWTGAGSSNSVIRDIRPTL